MTEQETLAINTSDITEVEVRLTYATVTLLNGSYILIGVSAAHQLMTILGEDRLINVTCKYGDKVDAKKLH